MWDLTAITCTQFSRRETNLKHTQLLMDDQVEGLSLAWAGKAVIACGNFLRSDFFR